MVMKLEKVVPFGRSLDEYKKMFDLSSEDLHKCILGVGDGPASFNAEATVTGAKITSIDPIYQFSGAEIKQRFDAVVDNIIDQVVASLNNWVWQYHKTPQELKASRMKTIEEEMLRVSQEVRIFPLLTLSQETSPYLDDVINQFSQLGYSISTVKVPYEFQPGANKMLVINKTILT